MSERRGPAWTEFQLLALAACLLAAIGVFHLGLAAHGRPMYRDSHLGAALEYAKTHIDLLRPVIIGFNATGVPTPQEFPLWQAAAAVAFKMFGPWLGWANVVSLVLFSTCLVPLYLIARMIYGARCAAWTMVFFLAQPLIFVHSGVAGTDGFSITCAIWFAYFALQLLQTKRLIWWLPTFLAGTLSALLKMPFFMAAGIGIFLMTVVHHRSSLRAWLLLGSAALGIAVVFRIWTGYTDRCIAGAEFGYVDLRASAGNMKSWYFGDLDYRMSAKHWLLGMWRVINGCFGSMALAGFFAAGLLFVRQHLFAKFWLLGGLCSTLIFTHLVLHHWHYYLMLTPAVALVCALTAAAWEKQMEIERRWQAWLAMGVLVATLLLSLAQGLIAMRLPLLLDSYERDMAKLIRQYTKESDKLLIAGGGWGGEALFLADRQGLSIWDTKFLEDADKLKRLKELGYTKVVLISQSPLLAATTATNPGEGLTPRETYRNVITPGVDAWPVVFQDDNILIKDIP